MKRRKVFLIIAVLTMLLSLVITVKLQSKDMMVLSGPYRITMYTSPRVIQPGEIQIAFRVQDRRYAITDNVEVSGTIQHEQNEIDTLSLRKGQGKDFKTWAILNNTGQYNIKLTVKEAGHQPEQAVFKLQVRKKK